MLQKLIGALAPQQYTASVISLTSVSTIGAELQREGVPVQALGGRGGVLFPHQLWTLLRAYRRAQPDIAIRTVEAAKRESFCYGPSLRYVERAAWPHNSLYIESEIRRRRRNWIVICQIVHPKALVVIA